jgi:hypothetical protein
MPQYRKKPVVIEAIQWDGTTDCWMRVREWAPPGRPISRRSDKGGYLTIETLEGEMRADVGDYVIKGVKGEVYPCKPDIFDLTYEPA